jgi:Tol biopolymer transport system component
MPAVSLDPGTQFGPYEVEALLGAGAMGEVYRARDTRLRRSVAMKVLAGSLAEDDERLVRFEREARAAGALNHPNILAIHDMGRHDGTPYVVSELLEGQTLRERLSAGALPVRKVVDYSIQIARGLAAAHEKGIVHRDLKPENLFVTREGALKILDFGLAKLTPAPQFTPDDISQNPTQPGTVLGTVGYMSPEQVRGQAVDHRSDIFSFGAILYELLTSRKAFRGRSAVETMHAILRDDPPQVTDINPDLPPAVERIVAHCLEKEPGHRFQSTRDLVFDLEALSQASSPSVGTLARRATRPWLRRLAWAAGLVGLPTLGFLLGHQSPAAVPGFHRLTFQRGLVGSARIAPDGQVVYSAAWDDQIPALFAVQPGTPESRPLGVQRALVVAASRSDAIVQIFREDHPSVLARIPLAGGPPREIVEDVVTADATADGSRVAVVRQKDGKHRIEFPLGQMLYETAADLTDPRISPDGTRVAFLEHPLAGDDRGHVGLVDAKGQHRRLSSDYGSAQGLAWTPSGEEVWFTAARVGSESALQAVNLDGDERQVMRVPGRLILHDIAADGRVLLQRTAVRMESKLKRAGDEAERDFAWFDHTAPVAFSPDGSQVLFYESGEGGGEGYAIYLRGTDGSLPIRLGEGRATALSPDGRWAAAVPLGDPPRLVLLPTGAGEPRTFQDPAIEAFHWASFFPDGKRLLVSATPRGEGIRAFALDVESGHFEKLSAEGLILGKEGLPSPEGDLLVAYAEKTFDPVLLELSTGKHRSIPGVEKGDIPIGWAGGALHVRRHQRGGSKVFRIDPKTGKRELWREIKVADSAGAPSIGTVLIASDGKSYLYSYRRALSDLYVVEGLS